MSKKLTGDIISQQLKYYDTYLKIAKNPRYTKTWKYIAGSLTKKGLKILDIGCTNGDFCAPLVRMGFECHGLEIVDKAIKESRRKGINVKKGSFVEAFPYANNFFDIVFAGEVIEHTVDDDKFLLEINRVLKKRGLVIVTTPNLVSLGNRLFMGLGMMPRFSYSEFHYRIYNLALLKSKFNENGFRIRRINSSYILISTYFNKYLGIIGEFLGSVFPSLGEHIIIFAEKI